MIEVPLAAASPGIITGLVLFLVFTLAIGVFSNRMVRKSSRRYIVAGKSLPLFFVGTMLAAAAVDGNGTLGSIGLGYDYGIWAAAAIPIGVIIVMLLLGAFYAKKLNNMSMLTLPDFYYRRYGPNTEALSVLVMILGFIIMIAGNFAATAFVLKWVFGISFLQGLLLGAAIVAVYSALGGLFSSAYTDVLQVYIAVIGLWAAFIYITFGFTGHSFHELWNNAPPNYVDFSGLTDRSNGALVNWAGIISLAVGDIVAMDFMERVFAARDGRTASRGAYWSAGICALVALPIMFISIYALTLAPKMTSGFEAFPEVAIHHVPTWIGILLVTGVVGAAMSTANSGMLALSAGISRNLVQRNIVHRFLHRESIGNRKLLLTTRLMLIPLVGLSLYWAWEIPQPGKYAILAFDVVLAGCFWPLTLGIYWRKANAPAAIASIVIGSLCRLIGYFVTPSDWSGIETLLPPVVSLFVFVGVALATQKRQPGERLHGVIDYAPPEEDLVAGDDLKGYAFPGKPRAPEPVPEPASTS
jgi:SSS family solute:Na+ symporter